MESLSNFATLELNTLESRFIPNLVRTLLQLYRTSMLAGGYCIPLLHYKGIAQGDDVDLFVTSQFEFNLIIAKLEQTEGVSLKSKTKFAHTFSVDDEIWYRLQVIPKFEFDNHVQVLESFDIVQSMVGVYCTEHNVLTKKYHVGAASKSLTLNVDAIKHQRYTLKRLFKYVKKGFFPGSSIDAYYEHIVKLVAEKGIPDEDEAYATEDLDAKGNVRKEEVNIF